MGKTNIGEENLLNLITKLMKLVFFPLDWKEKSGLAMLVVNGKKRKHLALLKI